jgi:hypothetical protein
MRRLLILALLAPTLLWAAETKKPDQKALDALLADTDAIAAKVSELRGLKLKKTLARDVMSKAQIEERVKQRLADELAAADATNAARAYERLGLLPAGTDYEKLLVSLYTEQIAGFYDPSDKSLHLADWIDPAAQRLVMAHEIDHALQDQAFDLGKLAKPVANDSDATLARQALVEGDGLAAMIEFMYRDQGIKDDPWIDDRVADGAAVKSAKGAYPEFDKAPLFLQEEMLFPYSRGLALVAAARRTSAWKRVDEMYAHPPQSTEQVMHPERYFAGEKPIAVKTAALPSLKKWKSLRNDVMGELLWSVFLRQQGVTEDRASDAAEGWGGDRYVLYAAPDAADDAPAKELTLVSMSAWDSEMDATEAFDAAADALATMTGVAGDADTSAKSDARLYEDTAGGRTTWIERKNDRIVLVIGAPSDLAKKLRTEIWKSWR